MRAPTLDFFRANHRRRLAFALGALAKSIIRRTTSTETPSKISVAISSALHPSSALSRMP
jgi:hypothetical protein